MILRIKRTNKDIPLPKYAKEGDAGMDLRTTHDVIIKPKQYELIETGISMEIPKEHVGLLWDKSGIATSRGLHSIGGVIDSGYRGEIKVALYNIGTTEQKFKKGERIIQLLIQPIKQMEIKEVEKLTETERGNKGFGSTGVK